MKMKSGGTFPNPKDTTPKDTTEQDGTDLSVLFSSGQDTSIAVCPAQEANLTDELRNLFLSGQVTSIAGCLEQEAKSTDELSKLFSSGQVTSIEVCRAQGAESDVVFIELNGKQYCVKIFKNDDKDPDKLDKAILNEVFTGKALHLLGVDTANATLMNEEHKKQFIQRLQKSSIPLSSYIVGLLEQRPALWMDRVEGLEGDNPECLVIQEELSKGKLNEPKVMMVVRAFLATRLLASGDGIGDPFSSKENSHLSNFFNPNSGNLLNNQDGNVVLLDQKIGVGEGSYCDLSICGEDSSHIRNSLMKWWEVIICELRKLKIEGYNANCELSDTLESAVFSILNYHENAYISNRNNQYGDYKIRVIKLMNDVLSEFEQINREDFQRYLKESGIPEDLQNYVLSIHDLIKQRNTELKSVAS